jgi:hypothetical protein
MSSGVSRVAVGAYVGTGAALEIKGEKVDFKPRKVEIHRVETAIDKFEWVEGMDDGTMLQTVGATGVRTLVATQAITPLTSGFSLGTNAQVNAAGGTYRYVAWE